MRLAGLPPWGTKPATVPGAPLAVDAALWVSAADVRLLATLCAVAVRPDAGGLDGAVVDGVAGAGEIPSLPSAPLPKPATGAEP